jgi:hypothetical protein
MLSYSQNGPMSTYRIGAFGWAFDTVRTDADPSRTQNQVATDSILPEVEPGRRNKDPDPKEPALISPIGDFVYSNGSELWTICLRPSQYGIFDWA